MSKTSYWTLFAAVQIAGIALPIWGKMHSHLAVIGGLLLLIPGDLFVSVFSGKLSPYIFYPAVLLVNTGAWYLLRKMLLPNTFPESGIDG